MFVNAQRESASARKKRLLTPEQAVLLVAAEYRELLKLRNLNIEQKARLAFILEKAITNEKLNKAINKVEVEHFLSNKRRVKVLFFEF